MSAVVMLQSCWEKAGSVFVFTTNQAETWVSLLIKIYLFFDLVIYLLIPLPWPLQRGLLLVVNWELVTVLVYRVVSWGLTCVKIGFKDWLDFCTVVSPCFLSCVPENLIWFKTWEVNYKMTDRLNDWLVGFAWLSFERTDRPSLGMTNKLTDCLDDVLIDRQTDLVTDTG